MKRIPLLMFVVACAAFAVALVSCRQNEPQRAAEPVNTMWSATTVPTTQVAKQLGFNFPPAPSGLGRADDAEVAAFSKSCLACHSGTDSHTMHETAVRLACVDCHGGKHDVPVPDGITPDDAKYRGYMRSAHVAPRNPELWPNSANPQVAAAATLAESPDFVRFVNPGDLRAAQVACASCHAEQVRNVPGSMMAHGAMLWSAALYNNGSHGSKTSIVGEGYGPDGSPAIIRPTTMPTTRQVERNGMLTELWPLPRWEISQPGNLLRVFERGGKSRPQVALPNPALEADPGRPDVKLSLRGLGTELRTDPVNIGLQKTRLLDPTLHQLGTNDHPGDYRSSGCSACHVVYANDRSPVHSGRWAQFGNLGKSFSKDAAVNPATRPVKMSTEGGLSVGSVHVDQKNTTSGHPVEHKFVRAMPTSTCIVCHIHPGTNVLNSYLGYMWWDNEADARFMYPRQQKNPTPADEFKTQIHNPEGSAVKGLWSNLYPGATDHEGNVAPIDFLQQLGTAEFNDRLQRVQFGDFHGHGWVFRAVFKQDRHGNLLDHRGEVVKDISAKTMRAGVELASPPREKSEGPKAAADGVPVHLKDIHLERGMQCVDCHFSQDNHGDGNLYGETRNAVMIECIDCHGDVGREANILRYLRDTRARNAEDFVIDAFTGNAAPKNPTPEQIATRKTFLRNRFEEEGGKLWQKSALEPQKGWWVPQTSKANANGSDKEKAAAYAHTIRRDNKTWGSPPAAADEKDPMMRMAHASTNMSCYACHSSWNTSCFGCHLPQRANQRKPMLHNEGTVSRNYTNYNYQTLRDDVYMLGIDSSVKGNKVVPIRSACAVMVSSQDAGRQSLYTQQQTVSAEGFAGTAFSPYFPHTVRTTETKRCSDCHVSKDKDGLVDNNAITAQLLLQGTNSVNFVGKWAWVAAGKGGVEAVQVTEATEPQAVIGSTLHKWAYPDDYAKHEKRGRELVESHDHDGTVLDVQLRGEYLYAACGRDGFIAYDVANIDNKGFSERIITAPVSPLGQRFYVRSKYATSICSPSTLAIDPTRERRPENKEQAIHPLYAFLYLTDAEEGLIVIGNPLDEKRNKAGVATLLDGDPENNFLQRAVTFNPNGVLKGAKHVALHGHHAYVSCDAGVVVVDLDNPLQPRVVATMSNFSRPRRVAFQFRYGFVVDGQGLHVIDVTDVEAPKVVGQAVPLADARDVYVSRTYAYVAAGKEGLAIVDVERPERARVVEVFNGDGKLSDTTAVRTGMTNSSMFAYVADGRNGLYVVQLTSPDDDSTYGGFSPRPKPRIVAHHKTRGPAVAVSEGLDRDRAVDEAGHQLSVFGRKGARPFNLEEQRRLYLRDGQVWTATDVPTTAAVGAAANAEEKPAATKPAAEPPRRGIPRRPR
jgi:hypothetical protein